MSQTIDEKVLAHLGSVNGSTAWAMTGAVGATREEVSKACQRLKRKGLVKTSEAQTTYWQAVKP
jgi:predicted transcriptional regulator